MNLIAIFYFYIRLHVVNLIIDYKLISHNSWINHGWILQCYFNLNILPHSKMICNENLFMLWLLLHYKHSKDYKDGAQIFLNVVKANTRLIDKNTCPCAKYKNRRCYDTKIVYEYLIFIGMNPFYKCCYRSWDE